MKQKIQFLKDFNEKNNLFLIKVLIKSKTTNGNNKYKIEDKSMSLNAVSNIDLEENKIYLIKGNYLKKYKLLNIKTATLTTDTELIKNFIVNNKLPNTDNIIDYIHTIKFNDKFYRKIFNNLILTKLDKLVKLSATKFYTYNYEGGLLTRNLEIMKNCINIIKIKNLETIDKELLILTSLLLDISKLYIVKEDGNYNKIGQLLPSNIILIQQLQNLYQNLKSNYQINVKTLQEQLQTNQDLLQKLKEDLNNALLLKEEKRKYIETLKFKEEQLKIYNKIIEKKRKTQEDKTFLEENQKQINKFNEEVKMYKLLLKKLTNIRKNINKTNKKITKYQKLLQKRSERDFILKLSKIEHILLSYRYYITNKEEEYPRFIEAQIISHSYQQIVNLEMFILEFNKLDKTNTNYSNKLNKYLFKE